MKHQLSILLLLPLLLAIACKKEKINPDFTLEFIMHPEAKDKAYHIKGQLPEDYKTQGQNDATIYVLDAHTPGNLLVSKIQQST